MNEPVATSVTTSDVPPVGATAVGVSEIDALEISADDGREGLRMFAWVAAYAVERLRHSASVAGAADAADTALQHFDKTFPEDVDEPA